MNGIIVYESRNGSTKTYAEWLALDTGFACRPARKAGDLSGFDVVVLGSCVHAFKVSIAAWLRRMWPKLEGKQVVLFSVAGAERTDPKRDEYLLASVSPEIASNLPHYKLDGRMRYDSMRWLDRKMMQLFVKMTASKDPEEAKKVGAEFDRVERSQLSELSAYLKGLERNTAPR